MRLPKYTSRVGFVSGLVLTVVACGVLVCDIFADSTVFQVDISEDPVLEITLLDSNDQVTNNGTMTVTPSMAYAGFNEIGVKVKVGTNNVYGYNLAMSATNTALTSAAGATIPSLVEDTTNHATGLFWSSTYQGTSKMYYLAVNSSHVYTDSKSGSRSSGVPVRCIKGDDLLGD